VAYTDPFGLCIEDLCIAETVAISTVAFAGVRAAYNLITGRPAGQGVLRDAQAGFSGGLLAAAGGLASRLFGAVRGAVAGEGVATTEHGAARLADPSRLGAAEVQDVVANATSTYTQRDGASVFVQEVEGRYSVVVRNEAGKMITNLKNLTEKGLNRLARNYGWESN
jgi:hypothetical protein